MQISDEAQKELKKTLTGFDKPGAGIHIFNSQGCCGPSIQMDIATQLGSGETAISIEGIDFFVPKDLLPQLENVTIDYGSNGFLLKGLKKSSDNCCG